MPDRAGWGRHTAARRASGTGEAARGGLASRGGLLVAVGLGLWLTAGAWGGRTASGEDVMAHLIRTHWGIQHIAGAFHLDGWLPTFAQGYREFLFFGPGFTWVAGLVRLLTLGILSDAGALKVLTIASFAATPLATAFLARSLGLSARAAGIAAILSLAVSNPFGVGLEGLFLVGLVPHQVGASIAFVALGSLARVVRTPRLRWAALAAVALAGVVITHLITAALLSLLIVVTLPTAFFDGGLTARSVRLLAISVAVAFGLAAFWTVPFLAHRDVHGPVTTWATPHLSARLADIWHGRYLFRPRVAAIVLAAWAFGLVRALRRRPWAIGLLVAPVAYVLIGRLALAQWPRNSVTVQLENRGAGMIAILAVFPLAALLARITRPRRLGGDVAALLAAAILVVAPLGGLNNVVGQTGPGVPSLRRAARQLASLVPPGARFVEVREFPKEVESTGVVRPDLWLAWMSGRLTLNEFNVESSTSPGPAFVSEHLLDRPAGEAADTLVRLGVSHLVATTQISRDHFSDSYRFDPVWQDGPISIFAVLGRDGQPDAASLLSTLAPASARLLGADAEHLVIRAVASRPTQATVALACTDNWHLRINGRRARLARDTEGLCALSLPGGTSVVDLRYEPDRWDRLGALLSLLTLVGCGGWALRQRRAKSARS
ncbi:MAG: hypothetical protein ACYDAD_10190 [Acidimicrobiales bacterium]